MPATSDGVDVPTEAAAVAASYRRLERPISGAVAIIVTLVAAGAFLSLPLLWGVAVALVALVAVRLPIVRSGGTTTLATDADPDAVRDDFESPCPPPLAFQWGIADAIERTDRGWEYTISYLFGLRSTRVTVELRAGDDASDLELVVTAGGRPWGTYDVVIDEDDGRTTVEITVDSDRRFGLRRLPQWFVAERYRAAALEAQGYSVVERDVTLSR